MIDNSGIREPGKIFMQILSHLLKSEKALCFSMKKYLLILAPII